MMKQKIMKWIIFETWEMGEKPLILELSNEDINPEEIEICIHEQIYTHPFPINTHHNARG